jgi:hypothetical protein
LTRRRPRRRADRRDASRKPPPAMAARCPAAGAGSHPTGARSGGEVDGSRSSRMRHAPRVPDPMHRRDQPPCRFHHACSSSAPAREPGTRPGSALPVWPSPCPADADDPTKASRKSPSPRHCNADA